MIETVCCACGITFGVPEAYDKALRATHQWFYCPNGHSIHYPQKTNEELLREQLQSMEIKLVTARQALTSCQKQSLQRCKKCGSILPRDGNCSRCSKNTIRIKEGV